MSFTNLWPLFLLILIPIIILLYMLKQKAQDQDFSSVMLWRQIYRTIEAKTPWEKLKHNILMYIQILTILLLIFALMSPYLKNGGNSYSNVILVLDNSGSMNYAYNDKKTRLEEEIERALEFVDSLSEDTSVTVIVCSNEARIALSNTSSKSEIKKILEGINSTDLGGDLNNAISLVKSIANQYEKYDAYFFTDSKIDTGDLEATVYSLYSQGNNLSLDYVSYGEDENGLTVLAKVTNYSDEAVVTDVDLYGDDVLLDIKSVNIPMGDSQVVYFENVDFNGSTLRAEINKKDALEGDNSAYVIMNKNTNNKVLLITESNVFLEKSIANIPGIDLYKTADTSTISQEDPFILYIYDGIEPLENITSGNIMYFNTSADKENRSISEKYLTFEESDITEYINGFQIGVNSAVSLNKPAWAKSFLSSGEDICGYYGENNGRREVVIGFDLHQTDFALQAEFPILINNITTYLMDSGLVSGSKYIAGDKVNFNANVNGSSLKIINTEGQQEEVIVNASIATYSNTIHSGLYSVSQTVDGKECTEQFVVGYPISSESNVVEVSEETNDNFSENKKLSGGRDLRNIVLLVLLLMLMVEWIVYVKQQ